MNARIAKEIRLLLPVWLGIGIALISVSIFLENIVMQSGFIFPIFVFCCAILGVVSFGKDVTSETFSQMLAQPVPRNILWREKMLVSGLAFLPFVVLFFLVLWIGHPGNYFQEGYLISALVLPPLFAFSIGPLLVLLTRQVNASFWLLVLCGTGISTGVHLVANSLSLEPGAAARFQQIAFPVVLGLISITGIILTRRKFLIYEDTSSFSREISIPFDRFFPWSKNKARARTLPSNRTWNLIRKELRLQQINFIFILGCYFVLFLHLFILAPKIADDIGVFRNGEYMLDIISGIVRVIAVAAPFVIGAVAIAEERRLGVEESQLMLPVSRFKQWSVKLLTCLALSFALGGGFIFLIDSLAQHYPGSLVLKPFDEFWRQGIYIFRSTDQQFLFYLLLPVIGLSLGMLGSSLSRNYLQSVSVVICLCLVFLAAGSSIPPFINWQYVYWTGYAGVFQNGLFWIIGIPALVLLCLWLSYRNYSFTETFGRRLKKTAVALLVTFLLVVSTASAAYLQFWRFIFSESPAQSEYGMAGEVKPSISSGGNHGVAIGSDGTLWRWGTDVTEYAEIREVSGDASRTVADRAVYIRSQAIPAPVQVGTDSDWKQVVAKDGGFLALKSDGTLWALGGWRGERGSRPVSSALGIDGPAEVLTQVGTDGNWQKIAGEGTNITLGLKDNGTLWIWGLVRTVSPEGEEVVEETVFPTQIGNEFDWTDIAQYYDTSFALKADGSVWMWGDIPSNFGLARPASEKAVIISQNPLRIRTERTGERIDQPELFYNASAIEAIHAEGSLFLAKENNFRVLVWGGGASALMNGQLENPPMILKGGVNWQQVRNQYAIFEGGYFINTRSGNSDSSYPLPIRFLGNNWVDYENIGRSNYGLTLDGTLWQWRELSFQEQYSERMVPHGIHAKPVAKLRADAN